VYVRRTHIIDLKSLAVGNVLGLSSPSVHITSHHTSTHYNTSHTHSVSVQAATMPRRHRDVEQTPPIPPARDRSVTHNTTLQHDNSISHTSYRHVSSRMVLRDDRIGWRRPCARKPVDIACRRCERAECNHTDHTEREYMHNTDHALASMTARCSSACLT
jgi:hypothetical protein